MYGMIHRGIRSMVQDKLGEDAWFALEQKIGIGPTELLTGMVYEDALTIEIISEAAARLNLPTEECLFEFGRYWIDYASRGSLASAMDLTGHDLVSFISNLDRLHLSVGMAMPGSRLPNFNVLLTEPGFLKVQYHSQRTGLEVFVSGLFYGLIERFGLIGDVRIADSSPGNAVFEIRYKDGDA
jgi:guanylate cyclase soluble subunit beta